MSATVIRCPNCGGDVDLGAKECPYCNSDIVFDHYDERKKTITNLLKSARSNLMNGCYNACRSYLEDILSMDPDCSDAGYMTAALYINDSIRYEEEKKHASGLSNKYGIFGESDLSMHKREINKGKKKKVRIIFMVIGIYVCFFGLTLSLGLGLALGTLVPLYVTIALIVTLVVLYLILTSRYNRE